MRWPLSSNSASLFIPRQALAIRINHYNVTADGNLSKMTGINIDQGKGEVLNKLFQHLPLYLLS